jgi:2-C-methyl-D-erythritol 2,4-cyclodiphosphate synthase
MSLLKNFPRIRVGIGQDSHRFLPPDSHKPCVVAGLIFENTPGLSADSDGDVVLHAICNAISSVSGIPILGGLARDLCHKDGITDSQVYLKKAVESLKDQKIQHLALTIEGKRPRFEERSLEMRKNIARIMELNVDQIGITSTTGDGLTDFGCGEGLQCFCVLITLEDVSV